MSRSSTLSNVDLQKFCTSQHLPFNNITLEELNNSSSIPKFTFVFTGNDSNQYNGGYHNHWLFLFSNQLFDSYSYQKSYQLPEWVQSVQLVPKVIQQFGSNVCGEYCSAFYWFVKKLEKTDNNNLGIQFCNFFHLTGDRDSNDAKINKWFDEITSKKTSEQENL